MNEIGKLLFITETISVYPGCLISAKSELANDCCIMLTGQLNEFNV